MAKERRARITVCLLLALIAAQMLVAAAFGARKDGFDIDELFTYGLANGFEQPFIRPMEGVWTDGARFMDYLTVGIHGHEYLNVYENQIADVHPPQYYLLVHAVCSVFKTDAVSKWSGIAVNLACFALTQIALFFLGCRLLARSFAPAPEALLPVAVYGFGAGAITGVVFIRMYALMTLWAVLLALALVVLWQQGQTHANLFALKAALIGGFLTQYYFAILACMLCSAYFFAKLAARRAREAWRFAGSCFFALALAVAMFPWCMRHIFTGYRGRGAMEQAASLKLTDLRRWCGILLDAMNGEQFSGLLSALLLLAALLLAAALLRKRAIPRGQGMGLSLAALAASMAYLTVIAAIAPYKVDRYILCVYPLVATGTLLLLGGAAKAAGLRRGLALAAAVMLALDVGAVAGGKVNYLFEGKRQYESVCAEYADLPCVLLGSNDMTENLLELAQFDDVCTLDKDDGALVAPKLHELDAYDPARGFVLMQRYEDEAALNRIVKACGAQGAELLYRHQLAAYLVR